MGDPEPIVEEPSESIDETEGSETDEDVTEETEKVSEESISTTYSSESSEVSEARSRIKAISSSIELSADSEVELDVMDSSYDESDFTDEGKDTNEIADLRRRVREYRENDVGTQNRKGRLFTRVKGISLLLAVAATTSSIASLVLAIFLAAKDDSDDTGLTDEQKALLEAQVERWRNLSDSAVWEAMANYVDRWNPSWQAQLLMMDTIKRLATPLTTTWVWRNSDAETYSTQLVDAYGANTTPPSGTNRARVIYDTVKNMTYDVDQDGTPEALPRQIAADLVELAITDIVVREKT